MVVDSKQNKYWWCNG